MTSFLVGYFFCTVGEESSLSVLDTRARRGGVLVATVSLALALAGPARGQDDPVPQVPPIPSPVSTPADTIPDEQPAPVVPALPSLPETPALPVAEMPEVPEPPATISVTEDDAGNVDVSVRVLSPEETETISDDASDSALISDQPRADITAASEPQESEQQDDSDTPRPTGGNVNVTVRVLSPGTDETAHQDKGLAAQGTGTEAQALPSADAPAPAAPVEETDETAKSSEQYHDTNSKYQGSPNSSSEQWMWTWYLALDCNGNVFSDSTESGSPSSRDWAWDWDWEWACNGPSRPPPIEVAEAEPARASDPPSPSGEPGSDTAEETEPDAGPEPWQFTWTFTFCGQTVNAPLTIEHSTPLEWTWAWTWAWTCAEPPGQPQPGSTTPPAPAPSAPPAAGPEVDTNDRIETPADAVATAEPDGGSLTISVSFPAISVLETPVWLFPTLFVDLGFDELVAGGSTLELPSELPLPFEHLAPLQELATDSLPLQLPGLPTGPLTPTPADVQATVLDARPDVPETPATGPSRAAPAAGSSSSAPAADAKAEHPAKSAPKRKRAAGGGSSPAPPPLAPGGSGPAPGGVSGGGGSSGATGTAALTGFFVLLAPGVGRRIRAARGLRPRGRYGTAIDRPG